MRPSELLCLQVSNKDFSNAALLHRQIPSPSFEKAEEGLPDPHFARTRRALLLLCLCLWLLIYPLDAKLRCLLLSLAYSFVEYNFTFFERGKAYTSLAQFLANVVYMPVLVDLYGHFLQNPILYVLLFPANIWLLEIVQGTAIHWIYGRNVAWCYADYADELFGGLIRLGHAIWWWGLGAVLWLFYPGCWVRPWVFRRFQCTPTWVCLKIGYPLI